MACARVWTSGLPELPRLVGKHDLVWSRNGVKIGSSPKHDKGVGMKPKSALAIAVATLASVIAYLVTATGQADENSAPVYLTKIPSGYRDWRLISVAHE
jgi:hypothetical protein